MVVIFLNMNYMEFDWSKLNFIVRVYVRVHLCINSEYDLFVRVLSHLCD